MSKHNSLIKTHEIKIGNGERSKPQINVVKNLNLNKILRRNNKHKIFRFYEFMKLILNFRTLFKIKLVMNLHGYI